MKTQILFCIFLCLILESCIPIPEAKIYKNPKIGIITKTNVGDLMIYYRYRIDLIGFGEKIIYKGKAGAVITLTYTETNNSYNTKTHDIDFTEKPVDLQYTLDFSNDQPTDITVKNYKVRIIEANNNTITFILLSAARWKDE